MKLHLKYKAFIKTQPCAVCRRMEVHPHHMETLGMGGKNRSGIKDFSCVPLCFLHHREVDDVNHTYEDFRTKYGVDLWKDAFRLFREFILERIKC